MKKLFKALWTLINPPEFIEQDIDKELRYPINYIKCDNGYYFLLVKPEEMYQYMYNKYHTNYVCCILQNKLIFPRKSGAKYLTIY